MPVPTATLPEVTEEAPPPAQPEAMDVAGPTHFQKRRTRRRTLGVIAEAGPAPEMDPTAVPGMGQPADPRAGTDGVEGGSPSKSSRRKRRKGGTTPSTERAAESRFVASEREPAPQSIASKEVTSSRAGGDRQSPDSAKAPQERQEQRREEIERRFGRQPQRVDTSRPRRQHYGPSSSRATFAPESPQRSPQLRTEVREEKIAISAEVPVKGPEKPAPSPKVEVAAPVAPAVSPFVAAVDEPQGNGRANSRGQRDRDLDSDQPWSSQSRKFRPRYAPRGRGAGSPVADDTVAVSVVVLTPDGATNIGALLDALARQRTSRSLELVVLDQGCDEATRATLEGRGIRRIPVPKGATALHPYEVAMNNTRGEVVLFIASGMKPGSGRWLDEMARPLLDSAAMASVSGPSRGGRWPNKRTTYDRDHRSGYDVPLSEFNFGVKRVVWEGIAFKTYESISAWLEGVIADGYQHLFEPAGAVTTEHGQAAPAVVAQAPETRQVPVPEPSASVWVEPEPAEEPEPVPVADSFAAHWWELTRNDYLKILQAPGSATSGFHPAIRMLIRPVINLVRTAFNRIRSR